MLVLGMMGVIWLAMLMWLCGFYYRKDLLGLWREPVLKHPVLIIESDDWGAGPNTQASALAKILKCLQAFQDCQGHSPVMTLAMILAMPDATKMCRNARRVYYRETLAHSRYDTLREVVRQGEAAQIFAVQLHGMEHYWPAALMAASESNFAVQQWLYETFDECTESLPAPLQSRWTNVATLPSKRITDEMIEAAVVEEIALFEQIFCYLPKVVVPPTFVWNESVERAWHTHGIDIIVTPGQRHVARNTAGGLITDRWHLYNTQLTTTGAAYMVRNDYFEPTLGHQVDVVLDAMRLKYTLGRPVLLETHRFNFLGEQADTALKLLEELLDNALRLFPNMRFMSTQQLYTFMRDRDVALIDTRWQIRLVVYLFRLPLLTGFWRMAKVSGLAILVKLLQWVTSSHLPAQRTMG